MSNHVIPVIANTVSYIQQRLYITELLWRFVMYVKCVCQAEHARKACLSAIFLQRFGFRRNT